MSKDSGNKLARSIVAMLIWRKRFAREMLCNRVKELNGVCNGDLAYHMLSSEAIEASNAAESARKMLYHGELY